MLREERLTREIRDSVYEVYRNLGAGFLEKVYEKALLRELQLKGIRAEAQVPLNVAYKGVPVGEYFADLLVEETVLVELKAQERLAKIHEAQIINYLKVSGRNVGLLVNFAYPRAEVRRFVL